MERFFVDAFYYVALLDVHDNYHDRAVAWAALFPGETLFYTTDDNGARRLE